jgi:hypothetical protein
LYQHCAQVCNQRIAYVNVFVDEEEEKGNSKRVGYVTPALGTLWAHCVNTRLVLEYFDQKRRMTIAKSPCSPVVSFFYQVAAAGIEPLLDPHTGELIVFENPENYWEAKIVGRNTEIASGIRPDTQHYMSVSKQMDTTFQYPPSNSTAQVPIFRVNPE